MEMKSEIGSVIPRDLLKCIVGRLVTTVSQKVCLLYKRARGFVTITNTLAVMPADSLQVERG